MIEHLMAQLRRNAPASKYLRLLMSLPTAIDLRPVIHADKVTESLILSAASAPWHGPQHAGDRSRQRH